MAIINTKKSILSVLFFLAVLSFFGVAPSKQAFADVEPPPEPIGVICDPDEAIFSTNNRINPLDIRKTIDNIGDSIFNWFWGLAFGGSPKDSMACVQHLNGSVSFQAGCSDDQFKQEAINDALDECGADADLEYCEGLLNQFAETETTQDTAPPPGSFLKNGVRVVYNKFDSNTDARASIMGVLSRAEVAAQAPPQPTNLAYYFNRQAEKVPVVGPAYADTVTYEGPLLEIIYELWVMARNAAMALMTVVMIVVGIMIMTRRRLSAQTAVTVQYAIPRIILAMILIMFSYTIGATLASFGWVLSFSAKSIISSLAADACLAVAEGGAGGLGGSMILIVLLVFVIVMAVGAAFPLFIAFLAGVIITIIAWLRALIAIYMTYLKFLLHIIAAPIVFMLGAVPGNEKATVNWFKKAIAYMLGMFAASITIQLTKVIAYEAVAEMIGTQNFAVALTLFIAPLLIFVILIYGFNLARKMPKKLEDLILGQKR